MTRTSVFGLAALCLLLAAGGCAPRNLVVLIPDPDGKVGRVEVKNASGSALIERPNDVVAIRAATDVPAPPEAMAAETIDAVWGDALAAQPARPETFQLYFVTGDTILTPEAERDLPRVIGAIRNRRFVDLSVIGHADAVGSDDLNMTLSRERADVVRDKLVAAGIPAQAITVSSHGKRNPLVPTPDGTPEPRNRRVTITVR